MRPLNPTPGRTVQPLEAFRGSIGGEHWSNVEILRELAECAEHLAAAQDVFATEAQHPAQPGICGTPARDFIIYRPVMP